jgi:hypothetical protein
MRHKKIWKDIVGYEGRYIISNYGEIKSVKRTVKHSRPGLTRTVPEKMISFWRNHAGYVMVSLHKNGKKGFALAVLVAKHFVPNPENKPEVNHKKGNKEDNRAWMLEWNTRLENQQHSVYVLGKHHAGEAHYKAKLTVDKVLKMRRLYETGKYSMAEIGRMFGVDNKNHAANVIKGKCWKTLKRA